jgi:dTDP-4-dehydrorhamnose reductase
MVEISGHQLRIIITGGAGLLGQTFLAKLSRFPDYSVKIFTKAELDILDKKQLLEIFREFKPDWLINCAAITNVDNIEIDPTSAVIVNSIAVSNIAKVAKLLDVRVIHFSTDYVFDGEASVPYRETCEPNPINKYGSSKREGEKNLFAEMSHNAVVIRTAWLYGTAKSGFVSNIISRVEKNEVEIQLVGDQVGQITLASDVVDAAIRIIDRQGNFESEIYHVTNQNYASWAEIGEFVNSALNGRTRIAPILSQELNRPASRPKFSALDSSKFDAEFFIMRSWTDALRDFLSQSHGLPLK